MKVVKVERVLEYRCSWNSKNTFSYRAPQVAASVDCFNPTTIKATNPLYKFPSASTRTYPPH